MKKVLSLMLALLLVLSMAACGSKFEWTRTGYFSDGGNNLLTIYKSEDQSKPGWYVGGFFEEGILGDVIQVKGKTLQGDIAGEYTDIESFEVTVSEEGEDGVLLKTKSGKEIHFKPYEMPQANIVVTINTKGMGQIAYAEGNEEPVFDPEYPSSSAYIGIESAETYTFAARPDEGYKFKRWLKNGEEFSKDPQITLELTESAEYIAVFGIKGTDETPVDLSNVTTLGQVLGLPDYGSATFGDSGKYIYVFEQDDVYYRAIANIPDEVSEQVIALDFDDPEYDSKLRTLIAPLTVEKIENLNETILTQEQMDSLAGKKVSELLDNGWSNFGWNLQDNYIYMSYKAYQYDVYFEEEIADPDSFDEEDLPGLTVKSVKVNDFGGGTYWE